MNTSWSFTAERIILVGRGGKCPLQQESIMAEYDSLYSGVVLDEAGSVNCL